jgi:hypothetical protein
LGVSEGASALERLVLGLAVGAGTLQLLPIALGAVGTLHSFAVRLAFVAVSLLVVPDVIALASRLREYQPCGRIPLWAWAWWLSLLPAIFLTFLMALAPTTDPDGLGYHLTVPKRWLHSGSLIYLPTYTYSNTPMGVEMLFTIALVFAGDAAAKCVHLALGLTAAAGLFATGRRLAGSLGGAMAATAFLIGPFAALPLLGLAYVEGALSLAITAAVLAWLIWFQHDDPRWLRCVALLLGIAVSFKLTAALFALMLAALTLITVLTDDSRNRRWTGSGFVVGLFVLAALPVIPWLIRAALITGNPIFPLFAGVIPSRDFSPAAASTFDTHFRYWNWGSGLDANWDIVRRQRLIAVAASIVLAIGVVCGYILRSRWARAAVGAATVTVLVQLFSVGLYTRFWIAPAAVLLLPFLGWLKPLFSYRFAPILVIVPTLVGSVTYVDRQTTDVVGDFRTLARVAGGIERQEYLHQRLPLMPIYTYVNERVPTRARVLLTFNCIGFYLERTTFCDETLQESIRWTTLAEFESDLDKLGVTHIVAPTVLATGGSSPEVARTSLMSHHPAEINLLREVLTKRAQLLISASDQSLFVRRPARSQSRT